MTRSLLTLFALELLGGVSLIAQTTSPTNFGATVANSLSSPSYTPSVSNVGCGTGTNINWSYEVVAVDAAGGTTQPSITVTFSSNSTCSLNTTTIYNVIFTPSTPTVVGAVYCAVYRISPTGGSYTTGNIGNLLCNGGKLFDTNLTGDGTSPPSINSTGSVSAKGGVTAPSFTASGNGAGTSVWSFGGPLSLCSSSQPQPCIQPTNAFFLQAPTGTINPSFGWTAPTNPNTANGPLVVAEPVGGAAAQLSFGTLTDSTITSPPQLATTNGSSFTSGNLVFANGTTPGNVNLADSGIAVGTSGAIYQLKNVTSGTIFASFDSSGKQFRIGDATAPTQVLDVEGNFQVNANGTPLTSNKVGLVGAGFPAIVYNKASGSPPGTATNAAIAATTMLTSPSTSLESCGAVSGVSNAICYRIAFYAFQVGQGSGCSTNTTNIAAQVTFTDPALGTSSTVTAAAFLVTGNGTANSPIPPSSSGTGVTLAVGAAGGYVLRAQAGTALQYSTTVSAGTCSTKPTYYVIPFLEQI